MVLLPADAFEALSDIDRSDHVWTVCSCISTCRAVCNCIVDSLVTLVHTIRVYCSNVLRGHGGVLKLAHFGHSWLCSLLRRTRKGTPQSIAEALYVEIFNAGN